MKLGSKNGNNFKKQCNSMQHKKSQQETTLWNILMVWLRPTINLESPHPELWSFEGYSNTETGIYNNVEEDILHDSRRLDIL